MHLARRVNQLVLSGEWIKLTASSRSKIIVKLNALYRQICMFFSQVELKKILAVAAIFIGLPLALQSQSFDLPAQNPFGLVPDSTYFASPAFADIDNDGDFDLFTGNYSHDTSSVQFFENTGTANTPMFALPEENPFGITHPGIYIAFPAFADIDQDGDLDLFLGGLVEEEYGGGVHYYVNTGSATTPEFAAPQINPFGLTNTYMFVMPEFADIDNDGDLDLFAAEGYGNMQFFENTGTATDPDFATPLQNPFGITQVYNFGSPAFADIDHDGDLDLFMGEYYGNMLYFQNTGTAEAPAFATVVTNPFGLVPTYYYNFPAMADLDNDGDVDILAGEYYGMFQYFENTEFMTGIPEDQGDDIFSLYPNPATDGVNLILKNENSGYSLDVCIIDLNGRIVQTSSFTSSSMKLEIGNLAPGIYFVKLVLEDKVSTRKLIIR